jgi:hypothetical protein
LPRFLNEILSSAAIFAKTCSARARYIANRNDGEFFAVAGREWDGRSVTIESLLDTADTVVVECRYRGTYRPTGSDMNIQACHIWRLRRRQDRELPPILRYRSPPARDGPRVISSG